MRPLALTPWLLPASLVAMAPGTAQLPQLDGFLAQLAQEGTFHGSVLVTRGDRTVFHGDYGCRDAAGQEPNAPDSQYYAPRLQEPMFAALALLAQERGLLDLEAPLGAYLPDFRDKPALRVQDLFTHASGLVNTRVVPPEDGTLLTLGEAARQVAWCPLVEPPGQRPTLNGLDCELAGLLLETVTGRPCPALLEDWILRPLGMEHTGLGLAPEGEVAWTLGLAAYRKDLALWQGGSHCATGLHSTVQDLDRFFQALTTGRLLSERSWQAMRSNRLADPRETGAGVGLGLRLDADGHCWCGGWENQGFQALVWCAPGLDLRVVILANRWTDLEGRSLREALLPEVLAPLGLRP